MGGIRPVHGEPLPIHVGDELQLKKPHPCGGERWLVLRTGADLRLQCTTCGHLIFVPRSRIEPRVKRIFPGGSGPRA